MARRTPEQTASPARNFTLTTEERVGAMVTGPPAYMRRRKSIEDLSARVVELHRAGETRAAKKALAELVVLVEHHNLYYPMEANLPLDPDTSQVMELGEPWRPMPRPTLESLLAEATRREEAPASLAWEEGEDALSVSFDAGDERVTVRLDDDALSCETSAGDVARVATSSIVDLVAGKFLEIVTRDDETVRLPFRVEAALIASIASELGARLRAMRAAAGGYRD